ncbi:MAG: tripartite tricarboxylate transporter substrate binding protein [Burkholderiaceae bacterium]|nr:tripartite tricarboxylate transporter substrate binding protein [Desulfobacterales bacterium]MDP3134751.1 tripartite tricarboxylate transporter substrate binding protein [Burkholderiaceae bacterium]
MSIQSLKNGFIRAGLTLALGLAMLAQASLAQPYPRKPIAIIVPFPPGGAVDQSVRYLAPHAGAILGQSVVVVNRAGANGSIGLQALINAAPDGYTFLYGPSGIAFSGLTQKLSYDIRTDVDTVGYYMDVPLVLYATPSLPANTLKEFIDYAKANPNKVNGASNSTGSLNHLSQVLLARRAGIELNHIPYKGSGEFQVDLMAGRVQFSMDGMMLPLNYAKEGKVKLLAVTSKGRVPVAPDLPTFSESGLPDFEAVSWFAMWAPKGTPAAIVEIVNR